MMESELESLRPAVVQASERRKWLLEELAKAKVEEAREKKNLADSKLTQAERRANLRERFQKAVKSFMARRRIIAAMNSELAAQMAQSPLLPQQLQSQLEALRLCTHSLKYQAQHRSAGVERLQAWWRGVLARRLVFCLHAAKAMEKARGTMHEASVKIQSWYRASSTKRKWKGRIQLRIQMRREAEFMEQEQVLRFTIQLQRAVRARLARKAVAREKARLKRNRTFHQESTDYLLVDGEKKKWIDTWRPRDSADALKALEGPIPQDPELDKMREAGLIPFYSSYATAQIRHRIGGPIALKIQRQLGVGVGALARGEVPEKLLGDGSDDLNDEEAALGGDWDVYPEGISKSFLDTLQDDDFRRRHRKKTPSKSKKLPRKRASSRPPPPPPTHTRSRAEARHASLQAAEEAAARAEAAKAVAHLEHPLLEGLMPNVPFHPSPPTRPPSGRRRPVTFGRQELDKGAELRPAVQEDEGWGGLTGFYGEVAKKPSREGTAECRTNGHLLLGDPSSNKPDADPSLTAHDFRACQW